MRFQAVKYRDSDFPEDILWGIFDAQTGELYPIQSSGMAKAFSRDMNEGRYYSFVPYCASFMLTVSDIQPM